MWNSFNTEGPLGITAEIQPFTGGNGDEINAYVVTPKGDQRRGGIVLVHHLPGWDEFYQEFAERLGRHGYDVICPNLYYRYGQGTPDDVAGRVNADGAMVADDSVVADLTAARDWLRGQPASNGKVGIIGTCSGGRHAVLAACRAQGFDAVADLWGGGVVAPPEKATAARPVAPVEYVADLGAPLLGLFGNDDPDPSPADVDEFEAELKKHGKDYEFHRYDGAGHAFFYYMWPPYRQEQAMDGWEKVFTFFGDKLSA